QHPDVQHAAGPRAEERMDDMPHCLDTARRYADGVIQAAREASHDVGVAVIDEVGQLMQVDRLDWGTPMSPDVAEAKALTALNFPAPGNRRPSRAGSRLR